MYRYFTNIPLANELLKIKIHLTDTVLPNRKYLSVVIKKPKFSTKSTVVYKKENTLVFAWKSKRILILESIIRRTRDSVTINLSKNQLWLYIIPKKWENWSYATTYRFLWKSLKWWRKLFFMEMCVINVYIMHKIMKQ